MGAAWNGVIQLTWGTRPACRAGWRRRVSRTGRAGAGKRLSLTRLVLPYTSSSRKPLTPPQGIPARRLLLSDVSWCDRRSTPHGNLFAAAPFVFPGCSEHRGKDRRIDAASELLDDNR